MAEDNPTREIIPVLTWEGSPYQVQILDNMVTLYDLRDRTQMAKECGHEVVKELKRTHRASRANKLLESVFKTTATKMTSAERLASQVYDRVLRETADIDKAEAAFDMTEAMASAK